MLRMASAAFASFLGLLVGSSEAEACSFPARHHSEREIEDMARQALAYSTVVVDGEVLSPMLVGLPPEGTMPMAEVKVIRTLRDHVEEEIIPVAYFSSCDVALETKGQKVRILLSGAGIFTANQFSNGFEAVYERQAFNRQIDRLLGTPRPADFTDAGAPPPPKR